jgi:ABC-2 type transport system permease protein
MSWVRLADRPATIHHERHTRTGFATLLRRELVRLLKIWSQTIVAPAMTSLLFLLVFGVSLGHRIGSIGGIEYLTFVVPGLVMLQVVTQAYNNNSSSIFQGRLDGWIEDVLSAPMHAWQISVSILIAGFVRALLITGLVLAGARLATRVPIEHPFEAVAMLAAVCLLWGSVGLVAGIVADSWDQHAMISNLVLQPLVFVGGIFYATNMLPHALADITRYDPLYWEVDGLRGAFLGVHDLSFAFAIGSTLLLGAAVFALQLWMFVSGWRLKD